MISFAENMGLDMESLGGVLVLGTLKRLKSQQGHLKPQFSGKKTKFPEPE